MDKAPRSKDPLLNKWYDDIKRELDLANTKLNNNLFVQGLVVASANDLVLGNVGSVFEVSGTTQINAIKTAGRSDGAVVTLLFQSTPTVKHNTAGGTGTAVILLAGAADFAASAGDTLQLMLCTISTVQAFRQISRTVI
jgi:hypothetical protein